MYITQLPDHSKPDFNEHVHFERFGKNNIIFHDKVKQSFCAKHIGCLSIKLIFSGQEWYGIDGRQISLEPGKFLVLNNDQSYSCQIDTNEATEVFSIFFKSDTASQVFTDCAKNDADLLDSPFDSLGVPEFYQTLYNVNRGMLQTLQKLIRQARGQSDYIEETYIEILQELMRHHYEKIRHSLKVDALKNTTRLEIYKRVTIARDILLSQYQNKIDLSEVARLSCLSVPQLIRQYKAVFGTTPYQYLASVRLNKSAQLLANTKMDVIDIANNCGFESTSAYCRAFKNHFQKQPLAYRYKNFLPPAKKTK